MKVVFFGTPHFVLPIPNILFGHAELAIRQSTDRVISQPASPAGGYPNILISSVVTSPDRPTGRQNILTPSPVKVLAQEHQIPVIDSPSITQVIKKVKDSKPDVGVLAAYGKILPKPLIDLFPHGILVVHPSILPRHRGPSPVPAAILAGDKETGVTIFKMDEKIDHGPIVAQFRQEIKPEDTTQTLLTRLFSVAAETLVTILPAYLENRIKMRAQDESQATYTKILKREDGYIDLERLPSPEMFDRMIRAYHPWPGVWSRLALRSHLVQGETLQQKIIKFLPGQKIQMEGGKPMSVKDFLNGYPEAKEWLQSV